MRKLTDLTKEELIDLIVLERESGPVKQWYPMGSKPLDGSPFLVVNKTGGMDVVSYQDCVLAMPQSVIDGGVAIAWQRLPIYMGSENV